MSAALRQLVEQTMRPSTKAAPTIAAPSMKLKPKPQPRQPRPSDINIDITALDATISKCIQLAAPRFALSSQMTAVAVRMATGATTGQIARQMNVTENTIKYHETHVLRRTGARTRGTAVARLVAAGMLP